MNIPESCKVSTQLTTTPSRSQTAGPGISYTPTQEEASIPDSIQTLLHHLPPDLRKISFPNEEIGTTFQLQRDRILADRIEIQERQVGTYTVLTITFTTVLCTVILSHMSCAMTLLNRWRARQRRKTAQRLYQNHMVMAGMQTTDPKYENPRISAACEEVIYIHPPPPVPVGALRTTAYEDPYLSTNCPDVL